ncbi:asparagine synthase-related protein [Bacillus sp. JJ1533]|uniref:asparagine synthase-related protein n=1 Tax=Bacillus sp. JJ1533 TaxID=3122959 RepID=UPI003000C871
MFQYYNTLGFMNPFYMKNEDGLTITHDFKEILSKLGQPKVDPVSIIEMINYQYFFADRTIVKGINKTPFMAKPSEDMKNWEYAEVPNHGHIQSMTEKEVAGEFFKKLSTEIKEFCGDAKTVGILLSGGMDSRMVAGVLDKLIKNKELSCKVVGLTWGLKESRDVVYSERIVKSLNWEWIHFEMGPETLLRNMKVSAERGCEYGPNHLHAMPDVAKLEGIDCILAGSFGDSIGRGEYSGIHFTNLKPLGSNISNKFRILQSLVFEQYSPEVQTDVTAYNRLFPRSEDYQTNELQRQSHYMRRMLNPCMNVINQSIPLYQAFTTPGTFGFMWSLDGSLRNDKVYFHFLDLLDPSLKELPWARTGKLFMVEDSPVLDDLPKSYHKYGEWIRNDLYSEIKDRVLSTQIEKLNIFNMDALKSVLEYNKNYAQGAKHNRIDELTLWLATLSLFLESNPAVSSDIQESTTIMDIVNGKLAAKANVFAYNKAAQLLKK